MTSEPTKSADTPPTTVWSNDVAGGGVVGDDLPGVAGIKEGEVSNTTATSSSKKKKKKKKQQQQQKEKAEEELKVGGDDDDEDVETPGITEVTKSKAMSAVMAPVEPTAKTPMDVSKQDEVEAPAELDTEPPAMTEPMEPTSNPIEKEITIGAQPEIAEQTETVPMASSDSLFDPIQADEDEDLFGNAAAPAERGDDLFGAEVSETDDFAGVLETSVQEGGDLETKPAAGPTAQPIEAEQGGEAEYGTASIQDAPTLTVTSEVQPTLVRSLVEVQREDDLFAEEAGQGDDLFGAAEPDSAQLFGSSETAAQGEPVALEPVLSSEFAPAETAIVGEELFPDGPQTEAFDLGSRAEVKIAPAAVVDATEPIFKEDNQNDLFSGMGDAQEEYFSQLVQAGHEKPDAEADIPPTGEADVATEIQVKNPPAEAVGTEINGDQPSPDPFGADVVEDDCFSRPTETAPSAQEEDGQLDLPVAGRARASTKTSDLFETGEADDLFAGLGAPNARDDAFAINEGAIANSEAFGKLDGATEMFADDPSLATDDWIGQGTPAGITDAVVPPSDKPGELEGADLDIMGVPEGWVDGNGKWCWYTEDERMDVARQMVADGTAEAPEKPFPATAVEQSKPIETSPAPSSPAVAANPYGPSPAQSYAPSLPQSYTPYQPSPPVTAAAMPYVPTPARNAYTPVPATPYVSSAYSPSAYGTTGYAPSSSGSQPYGVSPAIPKPKATLTPALERTKTSTAYDPPVITSRNLSRPPSAAPVLSQYTPMPMSITSAPTSLPVSPPPPAPGPPRSTLPPRNVTSVKSTLGGRSTPTAYDPPVPAMSRQASYARLRPAAEVAPPLPALPPVAAPVAPTLPAPPPAPPRGPSRNANFIQPPPAAGFHRPPSRARNEAPASPAPVPLVPLMPQGIVGGHRSLPTSATFGSASGPTMIPPPDAQSLVEPPRQAPPSASPYLAQSALPPLPSASLPRGAPATASALSPNAMPQAGRDRLTPQRGEYDAVQADPTWPPQNVSPAKSRPILRQDTFQPPKEEGELLDPEDAMLGEQFDGPELGTEPTLAQEQPVIDPYKPMPTSAPAASTYMPVAAPSPYQPSSVAVYQPSVPDQMPPSAYLTPAPNAFAFPTEDMASPSNTYESLGVSNYAPAPENAPKSLSEDVLERASEKAKRVPCVSFGPQGQLLVVFQTDTADTAFSETGQKLLPAYGDTSRSQKVQLYPLSDVLSGASDTAASSDWPGPLFVDGTASKVSASAKKKRDAVNAYIDTRVDEIQSGLVYLNASRKGDAGRHSAEAKMIMLQVIKLMLAADGKTLTSDPTLKADLVELLAKHQDISEMDSARQRQSTAEPSASFSDLQYLSRMLIKGQQQEAQQFAMQQQLWSHALLISSVMGPQAWQACVDAFVAQTTSGGAELAQPLVTAYKLFGGTQQLAPADSQSGAWRDTVATVVANVKTADSDTLIRLADQLKQNNLVEASQLCYLLSPKLSEWASGSSPARVSLFGCRDISQTTRDLELSELIEYAISFKATPKGTEAFHGVSQLLPYKLQRAFEAFTVGRSSEARAYVDAVLAQIRAQKIPNPTFAALGKMAEALSGRIAGVPVTAAATKKGGKPNLENLGSWFEGRLTKFIAGDEEAEAKPAQPAAIKDTAPAAAVGPFSHYSAISSPNATPNLTRSSTYDPMAHQSIVPGPHTYRSGSAASYRPRQPSQLSMQRPTSAMSYRAQDQVPELTRIASHITEHDGFGSRQESELEPASETAERSSVNGQESAVEHDEEPTAAYQMPTWGQSYDEPAAMDEDSTNAEVTDEASTAAFINPMQVFMTPMAAGTPAPSYEPQATPHPAFDDDEDDDDLGLGNSSGKKPSVQADKATPSTEDKGKSAYEPAPKKEAAVAPVTAQKGAVQDSGKGSQSGSWLGKWWGGKKEETAGPGPVKAKLGDESAFYYDKDLKRWINKTAGATEAPKAPPPPPPGARATPVPTGSVPPSKPATPMTATPPSTAPPPPMSRAPSVPVVGGPPSVSPAPRSAPSGPPAPPKPSGMNAADPPLSDPLAAPPPRKGAAKGKKDLRAKYVNIM